MISFKRARERVQLEHYMRKKGSNSITITNGETEAEQLHQRGKRGMLGNSRPGSAFLSIRVCIYNICMRWCVPMFA